MLAKLLEQKLDKLIRKEAFEKLSSESSYRKPFTAVQVEPFNGESWMIVDNLKQFLRGVYTKEEAKQLAKNLNDSQEIETYGLKELQIKESSLKESTKNFKIKFQVKSEDASQTTTGEKIISAPDSATARKRVEEDNSDVQGFSVISVNSVD